ncbi:zinc metalloproteinase dpy-31 [Eurytemora carolleeae]|uniref:zinc metalloproteinase dpy-31 n=1 Tax=Eurytemora carolleeae TaxID=1294199 RepID=UPI000C78F639|nr:zinc metalloproteinase dpy-31 [Eurytemora carolleeae]|eukprot:XP_023344980.1 zinc metalloproteinase dpy-31-like [Eurytemora affinis]
MVLSVITRTASLIGLLTSIYGYSLSYNLQPIYSQLYRGIPGQSQIYNNNNNIKYYPSHPNFNRSHVSPVPTRRSGNTVIFPSYLSSSYIQSSPSSNHYQPYLSSLNPSSNQIQSFSSSSNPSVYSSSSNPSVYSSSSNPSVYSSSYNPSSNPRPNAPTSSHIQSYSNSSSLSYNQIQSYNSKSVTSPSLYSNPNSSLLQKHQYSSPLVQPTPGEPASPNLEPSFSPSPARNGEPINAKTSLSTSKLGSLILNETEIDEFSETLDELADSRDQIKNIFGRRNNKLLKTISEQDELKHNELDELNDLETEFGENEEDNDDLNDKIIDQEPGDNEDDPETINDLIEGDIAMPSGNSRLSINFEISPAKKWPNNTIPYLISSVHSASEIRVIESAMQTIAFVSCIRFRVWDGKEKDYLFFHPDKKMLGLKSLILIHFEVSLEQPKKNSCSCFCSAGRALHEIMHTLGFYHEHSRSDRDNYIKIISNNVRKGKLANFVTKTDDDTTRNFEYDYESIMHYGPYFFSKNKQGRVATIIPIKKGVNIGQREMLSRVDCMKVNSLYNCLSEEDSLKNKKIQILCAMVGF